jgi:enoyl-CoA hydratase/carnithine racemase
MNTTSITINTLAIVSGGYLGCIRLNKPKALNALDLEMVEAMHEVLSKWHDDDEIKAVFIDSSGDKAFCAGGDIVSMYKAMQEHTKQGNTGESNPTQVPEFLASFFAKEYQLDYQIHAYNKPIICWGNGIIMGGGLGVFAGASTRITTENSRVAMPEITIGLFPDVGASYFLNKMPAGVGKFLGLSGASINGADCVNLNLADVQLHSSQKEAFISDFLLLDKVNQSNIDGLCARLASKTEHVDASMYPVKPILSSSIIESLSAIDVVTAPSQAYELIQALAAQYTDSEQTSKMLKKASKSLLGGSPITAHLVLQQLSRSKLLSLADCFRMELGMAYQCSVGGEFQEGVRALLIDKDNQANWQFKNWKSVSQEVIESHFTWFDNNSNHPLQHLESQFGDTDASK